VQEYGIKFAWIFSHSSRSIDSQLKETTALKEHGREIIKFHCVELSSTFRGLVFFVTINLQL